MENDKPTDDVEYLSKFSGDIERMFYRDVSEDRLPDAIGIYINDMVKLSLFYATVSLNV